MDMEVVRLIVGVTYGPQLGCAGSDNGVDSRHLHLMTIDLAAIVVFQGDTDACHREPSRVSACLT